MLCCSPEGEPLFEVRAVLWCMSSGQQRLPNTFKFIWKPSSSRGRAGQSAKLSAILLGHVAASMVAGCIPIYSAYTLL
eukprot:6213061-Pleurochrysis_carterae.AAC.9